MILDRQVFDFYGQTLIEKVRIRPPFRYEAIFQNEGCFIYVNDGNSSVHSSEKQFQLHEKEAILFKCGTYFVDWLKKVNESEVEVIAFHLYPEVLKKLYKNEIPKLFRQSKTEFKTQKLIPDETISKFIENLDFYFQNPAVVNNDLLELKIKELILLLIQTKNTVSITQLITDLFTPQTVDLRDTIESNLYTNLSVTELAKLSNMSLSSFKKAFNEVFHDSPTNYINARRLEKAKDLLILPQKAISDIAYELGFNDPAYFTRVFKKNFGITPKEFRMR